MTSYDLLLAVQLMSEERVGKGSRQAEREAAARETDARRRLLSKVGG